MAIVAIGFIVAAGLQLGGLYVIADVMRSMARDVGRGSVRRLVDFRGGEDKKLLIRGGALYSGGIVLTAACGAVIAANA